MKRRTLIVNAVATGVSLAGSQTVLAQADAGTATPVPDETGAGDYLTVPGARLYYEVSGSGPVLLLIHGAPADADAFAPIVPLLAEEYTVVRYDTRGMSRSSLDDPAAEIPVATHADDARSILEKFGDEPADVLGSSGGAVISLALTERYPELVKTLVAHEPPLAEFLPEGDVRRTAPQEIAETYQKEGVGPALGQFFVLAGGQDDEPPPSAATPEPEALARIEQNFDTLFAHYMVPITTYEPDVAALQAGPSRVVIGVGETTAGDFPHDAALGLAEQLGTEAVTFPGGHGGYTEYPAEFTSQLLEVLGAS